MKPLPPPSLTRYQFLDGLHAILKPQTYLEVGVQTGASLALAEAAGVAIGIDIDLAAVQQQYRRGNQKLEEGTIEAYYACTSCERPTVDLAFIDGSHLFEDALRDFIHIERHAGLGTVVVFDDVLPYSQDIAWRVQPPGDWTGDVFKLMAILSEHRPDLDQLLVDVSPTGALVVTGLDPRNVVLDRAYDKIVETWMPRHLVPDAILGRSAALDAHTALAEIRALTEKGHFGK
jgi:hypothetical protein